MESSLMHIEDADEPIRPLQRIQHGPPPVRFDREQVELIRNSIAKGCNEQQFALFLATCKRTGLDPFLKQIYPIVQGGALQIITGIDGLRLTASRTGQLAGMSEPEWCGEDGEWRDVWLSPKPPAACRIAVYRRGCPQPFKATVLYREFARPNPQNPVGKWKDAPAHMLAVRAESHALRKAFPNEMADLRLADEEEFPAEPLPRPQARVTERPQPALNQPQQPVEPPKQQPRAQTSAPAPKPQQSAATEGDKCEFCFAPADKAHTRNCPTRNGAGPAQSANDSTPELPLQTTPSGRTPQQERKAAMDRMFAVYEQACAEAGVESDDATMRRHCSLVLTQAAGYEIQISSRSQMTAEQARECADWFEQHGLPQDAASAPSGSLEYDDPFQDE